MRDIKFRAWDKEVGIMRSDFVQLDFSNKHPEIVELMQYAGLHDKNGKEIYEGDILKDDQGMLIEVVFGKLPLDKSGDCVCTYEAWYGKCYGKLGQSPQYQCQEIRDWMEVIGNIYENAKWLEENK